MADETHGNANFGAQTHSTHMDTSERDRWIAVQKKTFSRWCNSYLKKRDIQIDDLFTDLSDGIKFLNLLEIIGGDTVKEVCGRKYNKKPKMRIHLLENCNLIIDYIQKKDIMLTNVGSTDIVDGNPKLILGIIWMVILRFAVCEEDGKAGKAGLLLWVQRATQGMVTVNNFDRDFADGKAFCAIIARYRPDLIQWATVGGDAHENCERAFAVAESDLGIDRLLDVEDVVDAPKPDEKSVMTYVAAFQALFANMNKGMVAAKSISQALAITRRHDEMRRRYAMSAAELKAWMLAKTEEFNQMELAADAAGLAGQISYFGSYRNHEKPPQRSKLVSVESTLKALNNSCKNSNRPLYTPEAGHSPAELEADWAALEAAENELSARLMMAYKQRTSEGYGLARFNAKLGIFNKWAAVHVDLFSNGNFECDLNALQTQLDDYTAYLPRAAQFGDLFVELGVLCDGVEDSNPDKAAATEALSAATATLQQISDLATLYNSQLLLAIEREKSLTETTREYHRQADAFEYLVDTLSYDLTEPFLPDAESIQALLTAFQTEVTARVSGEATEKHASLMAMVTTLQEAGRVDAFGRFSPELVQQQFEYMLQLLEHREGELTAALQAEQAKDALRQEFAAAAEGLNAFKAEKVEEANSVEGSLEEQMATYQALVAQFEGSQDKMDAVEAIAQRMEAEQIHDNQFTTETIYSCRAIWEALSKMYSDAVMSTQGQIMEAQEGQISAEDYEAIREVFTSCDENKNGQLSPDDFTSAVLGIGLSMSEEEIAATFAQLDTDSSGHLSFDEFAQFMIGHMQAGASEEDVLSAWATLAGGDVISEETIRQTFAADPETADYLCSEMVDGDFTAFTQQMFSR